MSAAEPSKVRVLKSEGKGVEIDWKDGHESRYGFPYLRDACPCATCDDERAASGREFGEPPKPAGGIPMYREPARPDKVEAVGRYAIAFVWNDGHHSGIYSWEFLRTVCPCESCVAGRGGQRLRPGGSGAM